jgi:hypothetical protein
MQRVHILSVKRKQHQDKISLHCTFEIRGADFCHYSLDQSRIIKRHTEKIRQGKLLENLLGDILFSSEGSGAIAAEGVLIGGEPLMKTVRVDFLSKSGGPVKIGLFSLRLEDDKPAHFNQLRAEISSLIFSLTEKNPKMRIKVKSIIAQRLGEITCVSL